MTRNIPEVERQKLSTKVFVHPEKQRERMKCSLADIESLSAQSKISATSALKSWTRTGALCSAPSDRAESAATC
jgi:hypothetical protein